jgi:hypothetical protein
MYVLINYGSVRFGTMLTEYKVYKSFIEVQSRNSSIVLKGPYKRNF